MCFLATSSVPKKNVMVTQNSIPSFPPRVGYSFPNGLGLDINCNNGDSIVELQKKFPHLTFIGTERNEENLKKARKKVGEYNILHMDIEKKKTLLIDQFQIIQISDYDNFWNVIEKSFPLLEDDGLLIMKYKKKDYLEIEKLLKMKKPKKVIDNELFERISLSKDEDAAFILK